MDTNPLIVINQTMGLIETRIFENKLLGRLVEASKEEIFFLKEQFGEEAVEMGMYIVETYASLHTLVQKLQSRN